MADPGPAWPGKIDEILSWKDKEHERDVRFIEVGRIRVRFAQDSTMDWKPEVV